MKALESSNKIEIARPYHQNLPARLPAKGHSATSNHPPPPFFPWPCALPVPKVNLYHTSYHVTKAIILLPSLKSTLTTPRFSTSSLHQRDPRSALFENYTGDRNRTASSSPNPGYGFTGGAGASANAYPGASGSGGMNGGVNGGFRAATPNSR